MKTFLPYSDIFQSAECLDDRRLNRQRSDVVAILKGLIEPPSDDDHPAIKMWRGNEHFLIQYGFAICSEHQARGNNGITLEKIMEYRDEFDSSSAAAPEWFGDDKLHDSHKSFLLRSQPSHYRKFWPDVTDELPFIWPRSPERGRKDKEKREQEKLKKRAVRAKEKVEKAIEAAKQAALDAGLDYETLEPLPEDEVELVTIGTPDEDLMNL